MPSVGEQLRVAREQKKMSVYDVAEITKIKTDHIRALEQGVYDVFAAPVYIRGFVRTYSAALHLDAVVVLGQLDEELSRNDRFQNEARFNPVRRRTVLDHLSLLIAKLNWPVVAGVLSAVLLMAAGAWAYQRVSRQRSVDPLRELGPGLYQPVQPSGGELLPLPALNPLTNTVPR